MRFCSAAVATFIMVFGLTGFADDAVDIAKLKKQIDDQALEILKLKADLLDARTERDALQSLVDKTNGNKAPANQKAELAPLNAVWEGKFVGGSGVKQSATMTVMSRDMDKATFRIEIEDGAIWDFACQFTGNQFKIDKTTRVRANKDLQAKNQAGQLTAVGGVTGNGKVLNNNKNFTFNYEWKKPEGTSKLGFVGTLK